MQISKLINTIKLLNSNKVFFKKINISKIIHKELKVFFIDNKEFNILNLDRDYLKKYTFICKFHY